MGLEPKPTPITLIILFLRIQFKHCLLWKGCLYALILVVMFPLPEFPLLCMQNLHHFSYSYFSLTLSPNSQ